MFIKIVKSLLDKNASWYVEYGFLPRAEHAVKMQQGEIKKEAKLLWSWGYLQTNIFWSLNERNSIKPCPDAWILPATNVFFPESYILS